MDIKLNELSAENIGSWPPLIKGAVVVLVFVLILVAGMVLDIQSQQELLHAEERKEKKLKKKFEKKQKLSVNLQEYELQMNTIQEHFGALLRQLPGSTEVPGLIEDISHVGLANGLVINSIKLKSEKERDFYTELPIDIVVKGGYHSLGQFVSDVSALPRIVTLHNFKISPSKSKGEVAEDDLTMKVTAKTYRYTAEEKEDD